MAAEAERVLISTVFRCGGCGQKYTYGAEHAEPLPAQCPTCDDPWVGTERFEGDVDTPSPRPVPNRASVTP